VYAAADGCEVGVAVAVAVAAGVGALVAGVGAEVLTVARVVGGGVDCDGAAEGTVGAWGCPGGVMGAYVRLGQGVPSGKKH
jgi:hypothetical protein